MTTTTITITISVNNYATGNTLGYIEMSQGEWESYLANSDSETGTIEAGDILDDDQIDEFGITAKTAVYLLD